MLFERMPGVKLMVTECTLWKIAGGMSGRIKDNTLGELHLVTDGHVFLEARQ